MTDEPPPKPPGGKRRRHVEGADTRALKSFEARDTTRMDSVADPSPDTEAELASWDQDITPPPHMVDPNDQRVIAAAWRHTESMSRRVNDRILELQSTVIRIEDAVMSASVASARAGTEGGLLARAGAQLEFDDVVKRVNEHDRKFVSVVGEDGKNGAIGQVRHDLAGMRKIVIVAITAALGQVGVTVKTLYEAGQEAGAERARIERLERDVAELEELLRSMPRSRRDKEEP